jgi:amino acid adenylation domain-containing protein
MNPSIISGFLRSVEAYPSRPAVETPELRVSYGELADLAGRVCSALATADAEPGGFSAILGGQSVATFGAILGSLLRGQAYVPLGLDYPAARNAEMLERSGARTLFVDRAGLPALAKVLEAVSAPITVWLLEDEAGPRPEFVHHRIFGLEELPTGRIGDRRAPRPDDPAYVLFTSGTTGRPKGVAVSHANVRAFLDAARARFEPTPEDRFSHTFNLTFDLSVFDLFVAWDSGACVCCASDTERLMPARYIIDRRLSVWFSVPSVAVMMGRTKQLRPNQYPALKASLFCGEALPQSVADSWASAAPKSIVENLYGPTELTIACTWYRWDTAKSPAACQNGIVPIGWPIPGMSTLVADEQLAEVSPGEVGELLMTGPQLTRGYIDDPEKTVSAFVRVPERQAVYYRTGDLVRRPLDDGPLQFLGRRDTQVKIRGFRVELGEVEAAVRDRAETGVAVAVAWPRTASGADGIVVLVDDPGIDPRALITKVRDVLPVYMHPQEIRVVPSLPRNSNGKVDRAAVEALLEMTRVRS